MGLPYNNPKCFSQVLEVMYLTMDDLTPNILG